MCPENSGCAKSYDNPNSWMCCLKDSIVSGLCCTSIGENGECCDSNNKCCPKDKLLKDKDGNCYSCDEEKQVNIEGKIENCAICSNRVVSGSKKYCVLKCGERGTKNADKPLMDSDGKCHTCNETAPVYVEGVPDNCSKCPARYLMTRYQTRSYCVLCGVPGTPVADKKLIDMNGYCYSCDDSNSVNLNGIRESCTTKCPKRTLNSSDACYPACPTDKPLRGSDGVCHACDYELSVPLSGVSEGKCKELCDNRKVENGQCVLETCPSTKPLMDTNGGCHTCDEAEGINVKDVNANCAKCPSRFVLRNYCALCGVSGTSVADKKLMDLNGKCYSCDELNSVNVNGIRHTCTEKCPNRIQNGDQCSRDYCSENAPLEDNLGICHPCNEPLPVDVAGDETKCGACLNRSLEGQYCILN
ncbi:MAG: hypothetical protein IKZ02_02290, partial [Alphaproteobacteria bacterium]|nr:hypothetical protein [Alphaproteobacteria bacterium]